MGIPPAPRPDLPPNAWRLLNRLIDDGPQYRADLARSLRVSRTTVTNLTSLLINSGLLEELDDSSGTLKQPLGITPSLGVTGCLAYFIDTCVLMLATFDGRLLSYETQPLTMTATPLDRVNAGIQLIKSSLTRSGLSHESLCGLCVAVDAQVNTRTGDIDAPIASVRWYGVNPLTQIHQHFGIPIVVANTIHISGLAETLWGAGTQYADTLYVSISNGVATAHICDDQVISGAHGGAGEYGHMIYQWDGPVCACGNRGCVMQYVSVPALLRDWNAVTAQEKTWEEFLTAAHHGDPIVTQILDHAALVCARTLTNAAHIIDPEAIIIADSGAGSIPQFVESVAQQIRTYALPLISRTIHVTQASLREIKKETARAGVVVARSTPAIRDRALTCQPAALPAGHAD